MSKDECLCGLYPLDAAHSLGTSICPVHAADAQPTMVALMLETERKMCEATGMTREEMRALKDKFQALGKTLEEFQAILKWKAARIGNKIEFTKPN
jgi:hypothetical protein